MSKKMQMPNFGVGTFRLKDQVATDSVRWALELGYRAVDTAQTYENEAAVGKAIAESSVSRDEVFVTTKIWVSNFSKNKFIPSLEESLRKLRTDYVNLLLIHWPSPHNEVPLEEFMVELVKAKELGLTHEVGVSNFTIDLMQRAIGIVGEGVIATNQIELSPYLQNHKVVDFARQHKISITSYMTLAYGKVMQDETIKAIAVRRGATAAQITLAWALQQGYLVIPSSTKKEHLQSNLLAENIILSSQEMDEINALECDGRLIDPDDLAPKWD